MKAYQITKDYSIETLKQVEKSQSLKISVHLNDLMFFLFLPYIKNAEYDFKPKAFNTPI